MTLLHAIRTRICSFLIVATFILLMVGTAIPAMSSEVLRTAANPLSRAASRDLQVTVSNLETLTVRNVAAAVELLPIAVTADLSAILLDLWLVSTDSLLALQVALAVLSDSFEWHGRASYCVGQNVKMGLSLYSVNSDRSYGSYGTYTTPGGSISLPPALITATLSPTTFDGEALEWLKLELQTGIPEWGTPLWIARQRRDLPMARKLQQYINYKPATD